MITAFARKSERPALRSFGEVPNWVRGSSRTPLSTTPTLSHFLLGCVSATPKRAEDRMSTGKASLVTHVVSVWSIYGATFGSLR